MRRCSNSYGQVWPVDSSGWCQRVGWRSSCSRSRPQYALSTAVVFTNAELSPQGISSYMHSYSYTLSDVASLRSFLFFSTLNVVFSLQLWDLRWFLIAALSYKFLFSRYIQRVVLHESRTEHTVRITFINIQSLTALIYSIGIVKIQKKKDFLSVMER